MRIAFFVALLLVPAAQAGSAPVVGFLTDGDMGPAGDGLIVQAWPDSNESKVRVIVPELLDQQLVGFADGDDPVGTHLRGPFFVGLWPDAGAAMDSYLRVSLVVDGDLVAEATSAVTIDPSAAPDPMSLIPPDPTDPEGAVYHEVAQVMPLILQPPTLIDMGTIDVEVPPGAAVELRMSLVGADGSPPTGTSVALKYDGILSPSFVYMPWWSEDPEVESPQLDDLPDREPEATPQPSPAPEPAPAEAPAEESPGIGFLMVLGVLAIALARRR